MKDVFAALLAKKRRIDRESDRAKQVIRQVRSRLVSVCLETRYRDVDIIYSGERQVAGQAGRPDSGLWAEPADTATEFPDAVAYPRNDARPHWLARKD